MTAFTVTIHTLNQAPKTVAIESEYDLVLADDRACGIIQEVSEEEIIGYTEKLKEIPKLKEKIAKL